jgi:putative protease
VSVELLAPAGDFKTALAAFAAGADAVYCGLGDYSARAFAQNLSLEELKDLVRYAHSEDVGGKVYVAFNTLIDEDDFRAAVETLSRIADIRPDAVILQDIGIGIINSMDADVVLADGLRESVAVLHERRDRL